MVRLRISCRAEIGAIRDFLIKVNNSEKFIFLQEIEVKSISRREKRFYYFNAVVSAFVA
jgi:gluconate kinase